MGYLKERHGMTMLGGVPPGACPECARVHPSDQPHDRESLTYQYKFYDEHGRWPTWTDAMAHCSEAVKDYWIRALTYKGVNINK